ncbi:MAG: sugar ABC transporter substrate-binding protein [Comamonadaceae bacterium CG_4_9_14_3_um_filter_60_33]|nr:MAG: sugar ABC transporter substrate-binding protein [Comamonadaceae bacterium CG2_30_59_20]PIY29144.1 MAG: sugar ABC transporter substrate-binding protein [Comamonadaceae bacterium CG_4_10_14_3_um_filter_60_42]PJB42823.1 MAG: sugar ABC transporter substrate-binding protein [Comamonadaceae bacterium CG_4_9_14_3_um_filter_60_33]
MLLLRFLPAFVMAMGLLACGQSSGPSVTTPAQAPAPVAPPVAKKEIGLVMKTLTNPFFVEMEKGARRAEKDFGLTLKVKTAAQETSIEQQIQLVDDLVADKVAAIVIAPGDSQRLVAALKKAIDAGIKVVNIDNRLDQAAVAQAGLKPIAFVSVDNEAGAYKAGKFLAEGIVTPTQAGMLEGIRSADNAQQRARGATRALLENQHITIVASESANWKIDEGYAATKAMFEKFPDIKLLFAANDMMAIGAAKYLQESGKTQVKLAGFDALREAIIEIKAGTIAATIDQQAAEQGYQGIALANRLIQGDVVPEVTLIDTRLITQATAL